MTGTKLQAKPRKMGSDPYFPARLRGMKRTTIALLAFLSLLLSGTSAAQQSTTPDESAAESEPASALPATTAEDPEEAIRLTRELARTGEVTSGLEAIAPFIKSTEKSLGSRLDAYLDPRDLAGLTEPELREGRDSATLFLAAVGGWRDELATRLAEFSKARSKLYDLKQRWTELLDAEREAGAPAALVDRISDLLKSVDKSSGVLRKRAQGLLELDNQLVEQEDHLLKVVANLDKALLATKVQLLTPGQPALWALLAGDQVTLGFQEVQEVLSRLSAGLGQFWQAYEERVILHCALLLALLFGMLALSRSPTIRALEELSGSLRVLQRPVSSALLLFLFLTPLIYESRPLIVGSGVRLATLFPLLLLIPTFAPKAWRPLFYLVAALFGLDTLAEPIPISTVLGRLAVLAMSAVALWAAIVSVRRALQDESVRQWRWAPLARSARRIVILVLVGAIVANLVGAARLARFLNNIIVAPAYIGLGLTALTFVLDDFFRLLLNSRLVSGSRAVSLHRALLLRRLTRLTRWVAAISWVALTLQELEIASAVGDALGSLLTASATLGAYELSLGSVLLFLLAVWAAVQTARFIRFVLDSDVLPRMRLARGLPGTISTTTQYLIIGIGLLIAASMAGIDLTKITLIIGALSVGIGFGLQNVVNNFISGIILLFERPIQVGDTIQVGELFGVVRAIGIRASRVRTYGGAEVIVPNGELIAAQVINWTLSDRNRRLELDVGVAYGNRPADVIALLEDVVRDHELVQKHPEPGVRFCGFRRQFPGF